MDVKKRIIETNKGFKVGSIVTKKSGKPFKNGSKEQTIVSFSINEQDPNKRQCAVFSDESTCNLDLLLTNPVLIIK